MKCHKTGRARPDVPDTIDSRQLLLLLDDLHWTGNFKLCTLLDTCNFLEAQLENFQRKWKTENRSNKLFLAQRWLLSSIFKIGFGHSKRKWTRNCKEKKTGYIKIENFSVYLSRLPLNLFRRTSTDTVLVNISHSWLISTSMKLGSRRYKRIWRRKGEEKQV